MLSGHELSEDFQEKARTIFEAAVLEQVNKEVEKIEQSYEEDFEKSVLEVRSQLAEKVDEYLSYVAKEWLEENKVVVESTLKLEIMENFISGMKTVFEENYIEVPEEKKDLYAEAVAEAEQVKEQLNEEIEKNVKLNKDNGELKKEEIIAKSSEDLTDVEAEKFNKLAEEVEYANEEDFTSKVKTIKESYFGKKESTSEIDDVAAESSQDNPDLTNAMAAYSAAISKTKDIKLSN